MKKRYNERFYEFPSECNQFERFATAMNRRENERRKINAAAANNNNKTTTYAAGIRITCNADENESPNKENGKMLVRRMSTRRFPTKNRTQSLHREHNQPILTSKLKKS